jgi:1,4-dihydroxy-2-naphthoate octaprenyltransferase
LVALLALAVAVTIQLGVNYANDYSDFRRGADTAARVGPLRAAASGIVAPARVRAAALAAFAVAALLGLALSLATDWRLLAVGAACIAAAWLYSGGPVPYGYHGLGEVFAFLFFGLVAAAGTAYVQELRITPLALLAGAATGLFAAVILALNNLRDTDTDRAAAKKTLAVRLGRRPTRFLILGMLAGAFVVPMVAALTRLAGPGVLLPLLLLPLAWGPARDSGATRPDALVGALKASARLELLFSMAWAVGVVAT